MDTQLQPVVLNEGGLNNLWNNPFIYLIFFLFFGRGFMNGFGGGYDSPVNQQLSNDFLYSNLAAGQRQLENQQQAMATNLGNGICSLGYEQAIQFGNVKADIASCCCNTQRAIDGVNFNVSREMAGLQARLSDCCCETQKGIMQSTYAITDRLNAGFVGVERGICDLGYSITNAIHADGEATRALINSNTMQDLRDRLDNAQTANALAAQTLQLQQYINSKMPIPAPTPAFCVPSPFGAC